MTEYGFRTTDSLTLAGFKTDVLTDKGTWTPALTGSGGAATYATQAGRYVKIGDLVKLWGRMDITTVGPLTGSFVITLPFTASNTVVNTYQAVFGVIKNIQILDGLVGQVSAGSNEITLFRNVTDSIQNVFNQTDITDGARIDFSIEILI